MKVVAIAAAAAAVADDNVQDRVTNDLGRGVALEQMNATSTPIILPVVPLVPSVQALAAALHPAAPLPLIHPVDTKS